MVFQEVSRAGLRLLPLFLFVAAAFLFQILLIVHFALRKWRFDTAMRLGPVVYALGIPSAIVSAMLLLGGKTWSFWLATGTPTMLRAR